MNPRVPIALTVACLTAAACGETHSVTPDAAPGDTLHVVDRVVVHKGERKLLLMHGRKLVRSYPVELGSHPEGSKERAGDSRTPEGTYRLVRRNADSGYFLSLEISYPDQTDLQRARTHDRDAGGAVMVHGMPNTLIQTPAYYAKHDWTDGCIAVSNASMAEIWTLTPDNAPIDILP